MDLQIIHMKISNFNFESENLILKHDKNQGKGAAIITAKNIYLEILLLYRMLI